jgi:hypothetical protein
LFRVSNECKLTKYLHARLLLISIFPKSQKEYSVDVLYGKDQCAAAISNALVTPKEVTYPASKA